MAAKRRRNPALWPGDAGWHTGRVVARSINELCGDIRLAATDARHAAELPEDHDGRRASLRLALDVIRQATDELESRTMPARRARCG